MTSVSAAGISSSANQLIALHLPGSRMLGVPLTTLAPAQTAGAVQVSSRGSPANPALALGWQDMIGHVKQFADRDFDAVFLVDLAA